MQSVSFFRIRRALLAMLLACALSFVALAARAPQPAYADGPVYGLWLDREDDSYVGRLVACDATGEEVPGVVAPTWDEVTDLFVGRKTVPSYCFMWQYVGTEGVDYVEAPNIASVTCLDSCTTLEEGAFVYTSESDFHSLDKLESLTLSVNTVNVDSYTFTSVPEQTKVAVAEGNSHFVMGGDALYRVINDGDLANYPLGYVNTGETELVRWYTATGELTPTDFRSDMTVLAPNAMTGAQVTSITLPDKVTCIGSYAFSDCLDLTYLYIPASVEYLAYDNLARGDSYRTSGTITDGSPRVRYDVAESNLSFKDVDGALYSKSGDWLFNWQFAEGVVTVPEETRGIGVCAFRGSAVTEVTLQESVVYVCNMAFDSCADLTTVNIENPNGISGSLLTSQSFGYRQSITINVPACAYDVSVDRILYNNNESTENLKIVAQHVYGRLTEFIDGGSGGVWLPRRCLRRVRRRPEHC